MAEDFAIKVEDINKSFRLPHERQNSLKGALINFRKRGYEEQHVLKNISFEVKRGEFFGIVGRNGSGKSTLLKLLAGIYESDSGNIHVRGKLTPFIELGVGFSPELTGRENVFLNGALLGFSRTEMLAMYNDIVEFAELERFMDQKLKNYSSGMQVRLAFSIAIRADTDILVLDEVLAVGDEAFQRKCYEYFAELKRKKKTVILVTHSMDSVQRFCTKAMLLNGGKIVESGNPAKVAGKYLELNNESVVSAEAKDIKDDAQKINHHGISAKADMRSTNDNLFFDIEVSTKTQIDDVVITFMINSDTGEAVYRWASDDLPNSKMAIKNGTIRLHLEIENIFPDGKFDVQLAVKKRDRSATYALFNQILTFRLVNPDIKKRNTHWKPKEKFSYEQN